VTTSTSPATAVDLRSLPRRYSHAVGEGPDPDLPEDENGDDSDEPSTPLEPPPEFHPRFAVVLGVLLLLALVPILIGPLRSVWALSKGDLTGTDGDRALAAALGLPLTIVGAAVVALGAWMAVVEWRGRFKPKPEARGGARAAPIDIPKAIDAIGRLRGAALLLVVGAALMLGGAWIATGTDDSEPDGGTTPPAAPSE
jgi:hypothetical protein